MAFKARASAAGLRRFDMSAELRDTADRRKRPAERHTTSVASPWSHEGIPDIAKRLAVMFPSLGLDVVDDVVWASFHTKPHCSRELLTSNALAKLLEISVVAGDPQSVTSFEPAHMAASQAGLAATSPSVTPLSNDPRRRIAELTEQRLRDPRAFREAARARGAANRRSGNGLVIKTDLNAKPLAPATRRAQHFTLTDVDKMRVADEIANTTSYAEEYRQARQSAPVHDLLTLGAREYDPELLGRQALDLTNRYRATKGLAPCRWHDGIARIAKEHAGQMASGAATFSHDGFDDRVRAFPVAHRSAAENLAYNKGYANVAEAAVDGWIKSPGHEENLRGASNLCGIGVAQASNGSFYLTQLFASAM